MKTIEIDDKECVSLCNAIDSICELSPISSCCGHGKGPFRIWFMVDADWDEENAGADGTVSIYGLMSLAYLLTTNHGGFTQWYIKVVTNWEREWLQFVLVGPSGQEGYNSADKLAQEILKEWDLSDREYNFIAKGE